MNLANRSEVYRLYTTCSTFIPQGKSLNKFCGSKGWPTTSLGRHQEAVESLHAASLRGEPRAELLFQLAQAEQAAGQRDAATQTLQRAIALDSGHEKSRVMLAQLQESRRFCGTNDSPLKLNSASSHCSYSFHSLPSQNLLGTIASAPETVRYASVASPPTFHTYLPGNAPMSALAELSAPTNFVDRRESQALGSAPGRERRQFANSHSELSPAAAELARSIDQYKLLHRRRFIDFEEMLGIIKSLGYSK